MSSRWIRGPLVFGNETVFTGTGNYTIQNESILAVKKASGAATQVTLPVPATGGFQGVYVKDAKGDAAANNITIVPDGVAATTIDGAANLIISKNYGNAFLVFNGVEWNVLESTTAPSLYVSSSANGMFATELPLLGFHATTGAALGASATGGAFGYSITLGTSFALIGETSNNSSKTDDALFEFVLPSWYVAGQNLTVTVNAAISTAGSPTYTTKTVQIKAYRTVNAGTQAADIGPGTATAITVAGADVTFAITGTTLNPGDRIVFELEGILHDSAGVACNILVNSVRVS